MVVSSDHEVILFPGVDNNEITPALPSISRFPNNNTIVQLEDYTVRCRYTVRYWSFHCTRWTWESRHRNKHTHPERRVAGNVCTSRESRFASNLNMTLLHMFASSSIIIFHLDFSLTGRHVNPFFSLFLSRESFACLQLLTPRLTFQDNPPWSDFYSLVDYRNSLEQSSSFYVCFYPIFTKDWNWKVLYMYTYIFWKCEKVGWWWRGMTRSVAPYRDWWTGWPNWTKRKTSPVTQQHHRRVEPVVDDPDAHRCHHGAKKKSISRADFPETRANNSHPEMLLS